MRPVKEMHKRKRWMMIFQAQDRSGTIFTYHKIHHDSSRASQKILQQFRSPLRELEYTPTALSSSEALALLSITQHCLLQAVFHETFPVPIQEPNEMPLILSLPTEILLQILHYTTIPAQEYDIIYMTRSTASWLGDDGKERRSAERVESPSNYPGEQDSSHAVRVGAIPWLLAHPTLFRRLDPECRKILPVVLHSLADLRKAMPMLENTSTIILAFGSQTSGRSLLRATHTLRTLPSLRRLEIRSESNVLQYISLPIDWLGFPALQNVHILSTTLARSKQEFIREQGILTAVHSAQDPIIAAMKAELTKTSKELASLLARQVLNQLFEDESELESLEVQLRALTVKTIEARIQHRFVEQKRVSKGVWMRSHAERWGEWESGARDVRSRCEVVGRDVDRRRARWVEEVQ